MPINHARVFAASFALWATLGPACQSGDSAGEGPAACKPPARYTAPAQTLAATGCVDAQDPSKPAMGLIPYAVASPLWSDGAGKERYLALPAGTKIHLGQDGHFDFPVGTVLMKNFLFAQKIFETRLFMRFSETRWVGYSYAWNAAHTDAALVAQDGQHQEVTNDAGGKQGWAFPSQNDCLLCHNDAAGFSLGLEARQFDPQQLARFDALGVFDAPLPSSVASRAPLPDPADPAVSLEQRARSYLHANCAICHRPGGKFPGLDLRFDTPLLAMGICGTESTKGSASATGAAQRLIPGHPEQSTMYTRMATTDPDIRMPQVATSIVDPIGTPLIEAWIKSIGACR
jgi:uncharacterized repeat protein (TIGR03806 family)